MQLARGSRCHPSLLQAPLAVSLPPKDVTPCPAPPGSPRRHDLSPPLVLSGSRKPHQARHEMAVTIEWQHQPSASSLATDSAGAHPSGNGGTLDPAKYSVHLIGSGGHGCCVWMIIIPTPVYHALPALVTYSRRLLPLSCKRPFHCAIIWLCSTFALFHRPYPPGPDP